MTSLRTFLYLSGTVITMVVAGCTRSGDTVARAKPTTSSTNAGPFAVTSDAKEIPPNMPLVEGHVVFQGMVRPTKGGYDVRGVILDDDQLRKALAHVPEAQLEQGEWFLGAIVRITGELRKHEAKPVDENGMILQMRSGTWFSLERLEDAHLVEPAEIIEGKLERSKGYFAVGDKLISQDDVAWSLGSQEDREGDRVRLYGQSRIEHCEPNAQCLIQGSLPLFDVGRAERLP